MSIPKSVVEAALKHKDSLYHPEYRARCVIRALAENMPEEAVKKAELAYWDVSSPGDHLRAAIAAFLNHVAREKPCNVTTDDWGDEN